MTMTPDPSVKPMKIVHIEDFFHPDAGYQVNLLSRLQVKDGHNVTVVTAEIDKIPSFLTAFFGKENIKEKDEKFYKTTGVKIIRVPLIGFCSGRAIFYPRIFKIVDALDPDVAFVHSEDTFTGMQFIWRSSKLKYPIVLDCHMLEMASVNRFRKLFRLFYRAFITPIIVKRNIPLIRVVDTDYVEKCLGIPLEHTTLLSFGTDTDYFRPNKNSKKALCERYEISEDSFVVLYAGKLDIYKGGVFLAEAIKERFVTGSNKNIAFIIIGNTEGEYGQRVEALFSASENKIVRLPTQTYFDLAKFYQGADLSVFPKQCSMSFFEAQSCGLPVLLEINEINVQRVNFNNGILFNPEDIEDFRLKVAQLVDMPATQYAEMRQNARNYIVENYDYVPIARQFTKVLESTLSPSRGILPRKA